MHRTTQLLFIFFILFQGMLYAQTERKIDSLQQKISNSHDTTRIRAMLDLVYQYQRVDTDSALKYAMMALAESEKIEFMQGEALSYKMLASVYYNRGEMPKAEKLAGIAREKLGLYGTLIEQADNTNLLGLICMTEAKYYQSEKYYREALFEYINCKDSVGVVIALHNIGVVNFYRGEYDKVAEYYNRSLRLAETLNNKKYITINQLNLGLFYSTQKDFARAKRGIKNALLNYRILDDKSGIAGTMGHLGTVYFNEGYLDSSLYSHQQSLTIYQSIGNENGISQELSNIADIYVQYEDYTKAEKFYMESLQLRQKNQDLYGLSISYAGLGNVNYGLGNPKLAELYFDSALTVSKQIGSVLRTADIYESIATFQAGRGNYQLAYEALRNYSAVKDTLFSREKIEVVRELEIQYQTEKTTKDLEVQKSKVQILKRSNTLFVYLLVALGIIVILIVLLGVTLQKRQRLTHQKNLEIAEKNRLLAESNQKTTAAELERSRLEQEKVLSELNFKKKELTQLALHINQQNDFLESLKNNLKEVSTSPEVKSLERDLDTKLNLDKQREDFEMNIDLINEDFYRKLSVRFPQLNENEKKLCAMIRLNLSSKEIAAIQNISSKSVDMNRYRMRKKLNLNNEEDLGKFLSDL